ncbi:fasciclin-like arabinogalactan protein 21 [Benincasa hispida]|uniref:fasciclin-like arabinogalactan protein 21 n=1 Tax=Benincasa hispida TaxID=102211 RepID=UPI0019010F29|nr:fasciclin-like arabinogalactan protein 21 [Benincasa hispida]
MAKCSFEWWHAPIVFSISVVLAFFAITTALHSTTSHSATPPNKAMADELSLNASRALRRAGFNTIATLLQVSPEHFFSPQNSTIFAIKDSAISNTSLPPWLLKNLVQYHTSPSKLSMADLLKKPQGVCLPTLLMPKKIAITRMNSTARLVEINHVLVTDPDIFLGGNVSIHGVLGPFSPLDPLDVRQGWSFIQAPFCDSNATVISDPLETKNGVVGVEVEWRRIIRWLSANGFVSYAIGLQSVLEGILQEFEGLKSITVFAPPNLASVASPSPVLNRAVRLHIVPQMVTYKSLASLPAKTSLKTLVSGQDLEILGGVRVPRGTVVVNGVEIVSPEIFRSGNCVIHGISRSLEIVGLPHSSR